MKKIICTWLGTALLAGIAAAQTIGAGLNASIPFEFKAGNKIMEAGDYTVRSPHAGLLLISNVSSKNSALVVTAAARGTTTHETGTLVFNRYGDQYFLSKVLSAGSEGVFLPPSRLEREHRASAAPQTTSVVARRLR